MTLKKFKDENDFLLFITNLESNPVKYGRIFLLTRITLNFLFALYVILILDLRKVKKEIRVIETFMCRKKVWDTKYIKEQFSQFVKNY